MEYFYALHCPTGTVGKHHYATLEEAQSAAVVMADKLKVPVYVVAPVGVAKYSGAAAYAAIDEPA